MPNLGDTLTRSPLPELVRFVPTASGLAGVPLTDQGSAQYAEPSTLDTQFAPNHRHDHTPDYPYDLVNPAPALPNWGSVSTDDSTGNCIHNYDLGPFALTSGAGTSDFAEQGFYGITDDGASNVPFDF
jgi:hypothetical protein